MISHIFRPFAITKNLLKISSFKFSVNPTPNENPKDNENKPEAKLQVPNKIQQKPSEPQNTISRAQARLKVSRAELAKYARVELEYEKLHVPAQKLQIVEKYLSQDGFKIKTHPSLGTRLEFYRTVSKKKQPTPKPKKENEENDKKEDNKEEDLFQQDLPIIEHEWQIKVFTSAQNQFSSQKEGKYLDNFFNQRKQQISEVKQMKMRLKNLNINLKIQMGNKKKSKGGIKDMMDKLNRSSFQKEPEEDEAMYINEQDRFKEMTVYVRNVNAKEGLGKWVKVELMLQEFQKIHLYKLSVVSNMQNELNCIPVNKSSYEGVEAKNLDIELSEQIHSLLQYNEDLTPDMLTAIYYNTAQNEAQQYRKWLEDLIDITK